MRREARRDETDLAEEVREERRKGGSRFAGADHVIIVVVADVPHLREGVEVS